MYDPNSPYRPPQPPPVYVVKEESFTSKAITTLVLYFVMYIPGLIANIVFWNEARNVQARTGRAPEGKGCLTAMLIMQLVGLVLAGGFFCLLVLLIIITEPVTF